MIDDSIDKAEIYAFASCTEFIDALAGKAASSSGGAFAKVAAVLAICGVAFFAGRIAFQRDHTGATSAPLPGTSQTSQPSQGDTKTITLPGGATMEFIYVAPGSFTMGSPASEDGRDSDEVQHRVTLTKGYWLGKYEVTQRQWQSVMGTNPSDFKDQDRPVENVSWHDCTNFIRKINAANNIGARLPAEAEWEYACRAGTTTSLPNDKNLRILGDNNGPELDDIAWYGGNSCVGFELSNGYDCSGWPNKQYSGSRAGTHPVGRKQPNAWGFYDMIGNVWEWCGDWYGDYQGDAVDPQGAASGDYRVLRGGSWFSYARYCRSAIRFRISPGYRYWDCGLRLVCSAGLHD